MAKGKPGFASLSAKEDVVYKIGIIAATEKLNVYEVVEQAVKAKFPKYFD